MQTSVDDGTGSQMPLLWTRQSERKEYFSFVHTEKKKEVGKTQSQESVKKSKLIYVYSNPLGEDNSTRSAEQTLDTTTTRLQRPKKECGQHATNQPISW